MSDRNRSYRAEAQTAPATVLKAVVPSDAADLPNGTSRALFVGGAGALNVIDAEGNAAVLVSLEAQYHPIRVRRIMAAGTTATGIVALY